MPARKQNPLRKIGKQVHAMIPVHPLHQEQSQSIGAEVVESYDSLPAVYQEFFRSHLSKGEAFPYTVLTPTYKTSGGLITGKLVYVIDHAFYVLEEKEGTATKICYPIDEINYVEVTHGPSHLRVKVDGATNLGARASSVFGCSNTSDYLFTPLFQRIRLRISSLNERAPSRHLERLDRWKDQGYRVLDVARHCLMTGETVLDAVLQPEIRMSSFSPDKAFRGTRCPTHTCILTDKELIMIRDDTMQLKKEPCGSICNFVPLSKIDSASLSRNNGSLLTVSIRLSNGETFESLFDISLEHEMEQFLAQIRELMPKKRLYVRD